MTRASWQRPPSLFSRHVHRHHRPDGRGLRRRHHCHRIRRLPKDQAREAKTDWQVSVWQISETNLPNSFTWNPLQRNAGASWEEGQTREGADGEGAAVQGRLHRSGRTVSHLGIIFELSRINMSDHIADIKRGASCDSQASHTKVWESATAKWYCDKHKI